MTKAAPPLCFAAPIKYLVKTIGRGVAAAAVGHGRGQLYKWGDRDSGSVPNLMQALALDLAYLRAGGDHAPILGMYVRLLELDLKEVCRADLAELVALTAAEHGEAISHCILATAPNATPATIQQAIAETEQVDVLLTRLLRRLHALLPGNGAGRRLLRGELACEPS